MTYEKPAITDQMSVAGSLSRKGKGKGHGKPKKPKGGRSS